MVVFAKQTSQYLLTPLRNLPLIILETTARRSIFIPASRISIQETCLPFFVIPLLALFGLSPSFTPQAQDPPSITTAQQDPRFHVLVEQQFLAYEASLTTHCKDIHPDWSRATHHIYGTVELDKDGYPFTAAWAEQVPGTACGQPRRFRAMILVRGGKLTTESMLPGDSETSAQLASDVHEPLLSAALGFAHDIKPSCAIDVLDTHLIGNYPQHGPWQESWLVNICGHRLNIPITFIPDAKGPGTSFSISSNKITDAR